MSAYLAFQRSRSVFLTFVATLAVFIPLDIIWVGWLAQGFYADNIGAILATDTRWSAAAVFYLFYVAGVIMFCVMPIPRSRRWFEAFGRGAALGAFGYGTYNLTNFATLADWTLQMVLVDMIWGVHVTAIIATVSFLVYRNTENARQCNNEA